MKYICLVYNEENSLKAMSDAEFADHVSKCGAWVGELEQGGRHVYSAVLQSTRSASSVQIRNGELTVTDGPFAETKEFLGGFTILEARDLNEAIQLASKLDAARIGTIEVRPVMDFDADLPDAFDKRVANAFKSNIPQE